MLTPRLRPHIASRIWTPRSRLEIGTGSTRARKPAFGPATPTSSHARQRAFSAIMSNAPWLSILQDIVAKHKKETSASSSGSVVCKRG